jgi:translocation protein SEC62
MSDTRKSNKVRKRKEAQESGPPPPEVPTKEEYSIARWMRKNVTTKKTKFLSHTVEYFTACKAVDQLMDSPWAQPSKPGETPLFSTRESIVEVLDSMLRHKLFHRAKKIVVPESELKSKKKKDKGEKGKTNDESKKSDKPDKTKKDDRSNSEKDESESKGRREEAAESSLAEGDKTDKETKKKGGVVEKKKRKIRLDMHLEQRFVDGIDAYVWIYEPTPYYYYFFGFLVVIAVIAVCLFPLWPSSVRQGVYYLSLAAAGFLVFILALAVVRLLVFCVVWCITLGYHHFWLLPNLTEDVGFLASFWPLYKYEYRGDVEVEDDADQEEEEEEKGAEENETSEKKEDSSKDSEDEGDHAGEGPENGNSTDRKNERSCSETESEGSQPSQTGKDFEIVDREEVS